MSLQPEDPKLSAWLFGELSEGEAAEVERAVAVDPALQLAVRDLERVQGVLADSLSPESATLFPRQRNSVLMEARRLDGNTTKVVPADFKPKQRILLFFPIAAAAVLVLACWLLVQLPADPGGSMAKGREKEGVEPSDQSAWPSPTPGDPSISLPAAQTIETDSKFPALIPRKFVRAKDHPALSLPIQAGIHSLAWVEDAIREQNRLPSIHAVRLEEIVNRFSLRPVGATGIARGVTLSSEVVKCPWKEGNRLLVVSWRGATTSSREVTAKFRPDTATVSSYRLLDYSKMVGASDAELPANLEAEKVHTVMLEIEPTAGSGSFGAIEWTVDGQLAPVLAIADQEQGSASVDSRFAGLVASFGLWLSGQSDALDGKILRQMTHEMRGPDLTAEWTDFLQLVDEAAALSGR